MFNSNFQPTLIADFAGFSEFKYFPEWELKGSKAPQRPPENLPQELIPLSGPL
jgi:hypothetical protein